MTAPYYAGLISALVIFLLLPSARWPRTIQGLLLAALLVAMLIPQDGVNLAMAIRAVIGDVSLVSLFWLACACSNRLIGKGDPLPALTVLPLAILIGLIAILFYPPSLGLGPWDPYRLGYGLPLAFACTALILLCSWRKQTFTAMAISLALVAYAAGMLESNNLWDYLIDPWLSLYCIYFVIKYLLRRSQTGVNQARL